ncbi:hypothetical protein QAD02_018847 [Eretmocerus hayati]|uniref:Uncharacterized protein n=1 Tax=Eretmocerus hayati TaxID=131215 RepID=A0ACC2PMP2_9HYME|nr:hypothetical protein QAD02_018847 [Eretmocerus hayati]
MDQFTEMVSKECTASLDAFWVAVQILLKSPHLVNRRLLASIPLLFLRLKNVEALKIFHKLQNVDSEYFITDNLEKSAVDLLKEIGDDISVETCLEEELEVSLGETGEDSIYVRLAKLKPRRPRLLETLEISIIDLKHKTITNLYHKNVINPDKKPLCFECTYQIIFSDHHLSMNMLESSRAKTKQGALMWFKGNFFCKLFNWIQHSPEIIKKKKFVNGSLKLVSSEKYTNLYAELKTKYGEELVKIWPETTDPSKFVYEDVAIATYLLLLWEDERKSLNIDSKQSFLDLGCGNGLLVHILNSEGHPGMGIDLRRRKIWDLYPESTKLEVQTIIPSSKSLFPEIDWLIGNHSDELTPWIPVIAARSSYKCRFFLLPCCFFEFDGRKYQRDRAHSQYFEYMGYIQKISETCGFKTLYDRLRIPSTKRICLVGTTRNYEIEETDALDSKIQRLINARCNAVQVGDEWSSTFKPREPTERVRNCTKLSKHLITSIINEISALLLRKARMIKIKKDSEKLWNAGGIFTLAEVANAVDPDSLKELKNQCGGLQTLCKNNGDIFKIESGHVRFRIPGKDKCGRKKKSNIPDKVHIKTKPCWFYENHPDGCPVSEDECKFKH